MSWKTKLKLNEGDELQLVGKFEAGHLGQKERYTYEVLSHEGIKVGSVKYVVETNTKAPFNESYSVAQYDEQENQVVFERW
ncbi:conserved hypothetical protein [Vibrio chagasii]|nr:conserved hypothetical protein [Vibrio chagasii]CAH6960597.1 conserved hypothetical protein [Vibrio chagasii]CAH7002203.1 conserved hypothetical protein [Vibrio chagasii]CAH7201717.1 conserved hypothetical protein [Vibrio chagasii]